MRRTVHEDITVQRNTILKILKQQEAGVKTADICREHGISQATFYGWKANYSGMEASDIQRLRELETENARLKRMFADLSLEHQILKEVVEKKL
jgi:putative transposase